LSKQMSTGLYARVVVIAAGASLYETFTYQVPERDTARLKLGDCVLVPFSSGQAIGYVVELPEAADLDETKLKPIASVVETDIRLDPALFLLAEGISDLYVSPLPRAIRTVLPRMVRGWLREEVALTTPPEDARAKLSPGERDLLDFLEDAGGSMQPRDLRVRFPERSLTRLLAGLADKGLAARRYVYDPPTGRARTVRAASLAVAPDRVASLVKEMGGRSAKRGRVLQACANSPAPVPLDRLRKLARCTDAAIRPLVDAGLIHLDDVPRDRLPGFIRLAEEDLELSDEQVAAVNEGARAMSSSRGDVLLMHGVTASGKTEVYLRLIERALEKGGTAIVLLPEIALTTQAIDIFKTRFGEDVGVLHSALGAGERFDEWRRLRDGRARIALGPRSAALAPVRDLALVVVDEEQDTSYKQVNEPRYNARDLAIWRAGKEGAAVVLGSATPSLESFFRASIGEYRLATLSRRIENRPLPAVAVVDMREELATGERSVFSRRLREAVKERLDRGEQVILAQNRRAYAAFLLCRDCGHVPKCERCAVALRFHRGKSLILCHHCGYSRPAPTVCPSCAGTRIAGFGIGTERVEEEVRREFPQARALRMDRDTTARKGAHAEILSAFRRREADILVGTQMIAKGLDFPGVTLVGVVSADTSLNLPDFRAAERTYQFLAQVSGRSGRGDAPGEVVIQTFDPEHHAVTCAASHDYVGFYNQELEFRHELRYPPFSCLANVTASSGSQSVADQLVQQAGESLSSAAMDDEDLEVLGPAPCPIDFLRGEHRRHILLRCSDRERLVSAVRVLARTRPSLIRELEIDVDPVWMV